MVSTSTSSPPTLPPSEDFMARPPTSPEQVGQHRFSYRPMSNVTAAEHSEPDPKPTRPSKNHTHNSSITSLARLSLQAQAIWPATIPTLSTTMPSVTTTITNPTTSTFTGSLTTDPAMLTEPYPSEWWRQLLPPPQSASPSSPPPSSPRTGIRMHQDSAHSHSHPARRALFSKASYPVVMDSIISHASHSTRLALRLVCRRVAQRTDFQLFKDLAVTPEGFFSIPPPRSPSGPSSPISGSPRSLSSTTSLDSSPPCPSNSFAGELLPLINLWLRPDVASTIRSLTLNLPREWAGTALGNIFPGVRPDVLRLPSQATLDLGDLDGAGTIVLFADIVPATTEHWLRVHQLRLPDLSASRRVVYTVRDAEPDLLLLTRPHSWTLPHSVDHFVLHIQPHPSPAVAPKPEIFARPHPDDGAHIFLPSSALARSASARRRNSDFGLSSSPTTTIKGLEWLHSAKGHPSFLDGMAAVVAANLRQGRKFTLVGIENWDDRWLCTAPGNSALADRLFHDVVRYARRLHRWNTRFAETVVGAALVFTSEEQYAAEVGEERWRLETAF